MVKYCERVDSLQEREIWAYLESKIPEEMEIEILKHINSCKRCEAILEDKCKTAIRKDPLRHKQIAFLVWIDEMYHQ